MNRQNHSGSQIVQGLKEIRAGIPVGELLTFVAVWNGRWRDGC